MKNVFPFPKAKPQKEQARPEKPCEVINIADRTPDYQALLNDLNVDAWPFCAA